jgi:hypothetical protein
LRIRSSVTPIGIYASGVGGAGNGRLLLQHNPVLVNGRLIFGFAGHRHFHPRAAAGKDALDDLRVGAIFSGEASLLCDHRRVANRDRLDVEDVLFGVYLHHDLHFGP